MKKLIRYFTLRKRVKKLLVESVQMEVEWQKQYIKAYGDENKQQICKNRLNEYAFLSQKLRELL